MKALGMLLSVALATTLARAEMMNARVRFEPTDGVRLSERSACLTTDIRQDSGDWLVIDPGEFTVFQPSNGKSDLYAATDSVSGKTVTWMKELGWSFDIKEAGTYDVWMRARFPQAANYNHRERMDGGALSAVSDSADGARIDKFASASMFTVRDAWLQPNHWHWFKNKSYDLAAGRHLFHWPANGAWNGGCELDRIVLVRRGSAMKPENADLTNRTLLRAKAGSLVSRRIRLGGITSWVFEAILKPCDGKIVVEYAYKADAWRPLAVGQVQTVPADAEYLCLRIRLTAAEMGIPPRVDNFRFRVEKPAGPDDARKAEPTTGTMRTVMLEFAAPLAFNAIDFGEDLSHGRQIAGWALETPEDGVWTEIGSGTTAGFNRLERIPSVTATKVRFTCRGRTRAPTITSFALRLVPACSAASPSAVKPTARQLEWADCEIGVIIHHDLQVYDASYRDSASTNLPPANVFNPSALDTDQWIETAVAAGAKYAVLVAKHCSGFSLWPTKAHGYSVASSPWKNGKGDVVADFIASCRKHGVRPGIYASTGRNNYLGMNANGKRLPPEEWKRYLAAVKTQLRELWTNYGELFEIWFDGGNLPAELGGGEIEDMLAELQPHAIVFQGNPARFTSVRSVGNERAHAQEVNWSRTNLGTGTDGIVEALGEMYTGCRNGRYWCPAEADTPNRDPLRALQCGWFWREGDDAYVFPAEELLERYMTSVGRNCNMLIGMAIDNRGRVPDRDVAEFRRFGALVKDLYARPAGHASGRGEYVESRRGWSYEISVPAGMRPNLMSIQEDQTRGENVYCFTVSGFDGQAWHTVVTDWNVGHRRLARFRPGPYVRFRLEVWGFGGSPAPVIRDFSVYECAR